MGRPRCTGLSRYAVTPRTAQLTIARGSAAQTTATICYLWSRGYIKRLCELIGEPIIRWAKVIGEPIKLMGTRELCKALYSGRPLSGAACQRQRQQPASLRHRRRTAPVVRVGFSPPPSRARHPRFPGVLLATWHLMIHPSGRGPARHAVSTAVTVCLRAGISSRSSASAGRGAAAVAGTLLRGLVGRLQGKKRNGAKGAGFAELTGGVWRIRAALD